MPIKFAFSTVACPDWTIEQVAEQAQAMGYAGVELRTLGPGGGKLACDPALSSPEKVKAALAAHGIEPVCLSTSCALHHRDPGKLHDMRAQIRDYLEMAAAIGCPAVRVFGLQVDPGHSRRQVLEDIAENVAPLLAKAGELGVRILFENAGSFCVARDWWWLLDLVGHPMLGLCWNIANSVSADSNDRGGWVSVGTLGSRIRLAKVKDTHLGEGSGFCQLGDGDVGIETFIKRLRGVGYEGFVSVEWDRAWLASLAPAEEFLPEALERLNGYMKAIDEWMEKGRQDNEKYLSKLAPKSRAELAEEAEKKRLKAEAAAKKAKEKAAAAAKGEDAAAKKAPAKKAGPKKAAAEAADKSE